MTPKGKAEKQACFLAGQAFMDFVDTMDLRDMPGWEANKVVILQSPSAALSDLRAAAAIPTLPMPENRLKKSENSL